MIGYWLLVIGYWLLVVGYWLLVVGWWLVVGGWWLVVGGWLVVWWFGGLVVGWLGPKVEKNQSLSTPISMENFQARSHLAKGQKPQSLNDHM